jgi:hypothetical protein
MTGSSGWVITGKPNLIALYLRIKAAIRMTPRAKRNRKFRWLFVWSRLEDMLMGIRQQISIREK